MHRVWSLGLLLLLVGLVTPVRGAQTLIVGHDGSDGVDAFLVVPPSRVIWSYNVPAGDSLTLEQIVVQYYALSQAEAGCMVTHIWVRQPNGKFTSPWWRYAEWAQDVPDRWGIKFSRPDFWNAQPFAPKFTVWGPITVEIQAVNCTTTPRELYLGAIWTLGP